jgi:5-formyltetrahydrofolate cyclo-ligase
VTKGDLRAEIKRRVEALSAHERRVRSEAVALRVLDLPEFRRARAVMLFASMPDEVDTSPIIAGALTAGKRVALPRCRPDGRELAVVEIHDPTADLAAGHYGIPEPVGRDAVDPGDLDFVLVPGRAFDRAGARLGRGAAYYDRFLAGAAAGATRCAVCFDCQLVDAVPRDPHDVSVQIIVTESGVVRLN